MVTLKDLSCESDFLTLDRMLHQIAAQWSKTTGDSLEDLYQDCCVYYLKARASHDPNKSSLITWVHIVVTNGMRTQYRDEMRKSRGKKPCPLNYDFPEKKSRFHLAEFLESLSEDAHTVASLVLETPMDLLCLMEIGHETPNRIRVALVKLLRELGWTRSKINEVFNEVRRNLC